MEKYHVILTPDAQRDLDELDNYISVELLVRMLQQHTSPQSKRSFCLYRQTPNVTNRLMTSPGIRVE